MSDQDRRSFIKAAAAGLASTAALSASASAVVEEDQRPISLGLIGPGGMGTHHLNHLVATRGVRIAYVCDPDARRLAAASERVRAATGTEPKAVRDLREVLRDDSVDAVLVATPDHWHAPATVLACDAGKHVYVEKPCSHNVREGRWMVEAARRNQRVVQVGTQSRSSAHVRAAMELLHQGRIGEILVAKVWNSQRRGSIGDASPSDPPAHLDYDLWVGPAPMRPYQSNLLPGSWRWWYDFGCGDMGNDGVHNLDIALWGLNVQTHPSTVTALGGKYFFDDDQQFPDTQYVVFEYSGEEPGAQRKQIVYEQRLWSPYGQEGYSNGNAFYGTKGMLVLGHTEGWKLFGEGGELVDSMAGSPDLAAHHGNFFDCIRSGERPNADIEVGHRAATLCHLGNIATRVGRLLRFDPRDERILDDDAADQLLSREYRDHWAAPRRPAGEQRKHGGLDSEGP